MQIPQTTGSNADCCTKRGLLGSKHDRQQACGMSSSSIQWWYWSHHLEYRWYGLCCKFVGERDLWYHIDWADAVQEGNVHPRDPIWTLLVRNQYSGALENQSNSVYSILDIEKSIWWAIYRSQFSKWVLATTFPPLLLNSNISAM